MQPSRLLRLSRKNIKIASNSSFSLSPPIDIFLGFRISLFLEESIFCKNRFVSFSIHCLLPNNNLYLYQIIKLGLVNIPSRAFIVDLN
ncbi:hypothetical protein Bca4012_078025 [Brassica carinata]